MAEHIAKKSREGLAVYDISPAAYPQFWELGVKTLEHVEEMAECELIFLSLPNTEVVQETIGKMADRLNAGAILVDLSTIAYRATVELNRSLKEKGIHFLDAPVSGMAARARDGTLTIMCGGEQAVFEQIQSYLAHIGTQTFYMGEAGSGQLAKLINQLLFDINVAALAEILPMAAKLGLDGEKIGAIINSGTGRSYASEFFIPRILVGDFTQGYPLGHAYKDLISAAELAAHQTLPLPVLQAATTTFQQALLQGHGKEDKGAMIKVYERLLGVQYRANKERY
jgi:3-hydroxyisobutyrate dehydrogenase-like beta-hydroxyacid dehydrogenase